ncbi:MAG: hypothetical protein SVU88_03465 [Candidatus Nanohaloarchaea archaeon]|nr:hypothetical protein [Candidatus Nanohaloarchaea archaeon]
MNEKDRVRRFKLVRHEDESGVSGTGVVAYGCVFPNGRAALTWDTEPTSTAWYDSIEELEEIHGHDGKTEVEWIDE